MTENYGKKYFLSLAEKYPTTESVEREIIKLSAILELPKGTEHFISDIHGEWEALSHIMRNASGVIKRKLRELYSGKLSESEICELATLIYYPEEKLSRLMERGEKYFFDVLPRLIELCRLAGAKYTRAKVRQRVNAMAGEFGEIIIELINRGAEREKADYYASIYRSLLSPSVLFRFIPALCKTVRSLVVDKLHVVGDIFDRGAGADLVMDELMECAEIDFQWGNHDALWMGAAAGSEACCATAVANSLAYGNLDVLEIGYGISLRELSQLAIKLYNGTSLTSFMPRGAAEMPSKRARLIAKMYKVATIIQFKLEGQLIERNPHFMMGEQRLLHKIDCERGVIEVDGRQYPISDSYFPTLNKDDPYRLTEDEMGVISALRSSFMNSERLRRHVEFLYERGGTYRVENGNLLFHGCIPLDKDGRLLKLRAADGLSGRALMDYFDRWARLGYFAREGTEERRLGRDILWFLWHGRNSPLAAREKMTTLERLLIKDKRTWAEPRNPYYKAWENADISKMILREFGLDGERAHIINGHIPIKKGEDPIKAESRLIVIDGGFCKSFYGRTGIGGYTLIYNKDGMRISSHEPFSGKDAAIESNADIISETTVFEKSRDIIRIKETDKGAEIFERIKDLLRLLELYTKRKDENGLEKL